MKFTYHCYRWLKLPVRGKMKFTYYLLIGICYRWLKLSVGGMKLCHMYYCYMWLKWVEWSFLLLLLQVIEAPCERNEVYYSCCPEPYPDVTCTLVIERRPLFYMYNLVFPCMLLIMIGGKFCTIKSFTFLDVVSIKEQLSYSYTLSEINSLAQVEQDHFASLISETCSTCNCKDYLDVLKEFGIKSLLKILGTSIFTCRMKAESKVVGN